jgi:hypothetical protein
VREKCEFLLYLFLFNQQIDYRDELLVYPTKECGTLDMKSVPLLYSGKLS